MRQEENFYFDLSV